MLVTTLLALATTAALIAVVICVAYPRSCKDLERHLATSQPPVSEDRDGAFAWNDRRWALDRVRTRVALVGMAAYVVGMASLIPVMQMSGKEHAALLPYILMGVCTAALLTVGLRSTIHNDREWKADMKRRYPSFGDI